MTDHSLVGMAVEVTRDDGTEPGVIRDVEEIEVDDQIVQRVVVEVGDLEVNTSSDRVEVLG